MNDKKCDSSNILHSQTSIIAFINVGYIRYNRKYSIFRKYKCKLFIRQFYGVKFDIYNIEIFVIFLHKFNKLVLRYKTY